MTNKEKVLVIGGGGRIGYPFAHYCASKGHEVFAYDRRKEAFDEARNYVEENFVTGPDIRQSSFIADYMLWLRLADVVVIMIGTPIDAEGNPRVDGLNAIRKDITDVLNETYGRTKPMLVVLRSTVSPGVTDEFRNKIINDTYGKNKYGVHVAFCPERIAQGKTFTEMPILPQLIGVETDEEWDMASSFFSALTHVSIQMTTKAAELGKLMTNMYRYINFAIANEFQMVAEHHGQNYEVIRRAINHNYPRMNLAKAGPNTGGACLTKDGAFLVSHIPYNELVRTAFTINEGMPSYIVDNCIEPNVMVWTYAYEDDQPVRVGILGASFKAENDDTRLSLSFKLKKILGRRGYRVAMHDPFRYGGEWANSADLKDCRVIVLMTPHSDYNQDFYDRYIAKGTLVVDLWNHFPSSSEQTVYYKDPL